MLEQDLITEITFKLLDEDKKDNILVCIVSEKTDPNALNKKINEIVENHQIKSSKNIIIKKIKDLEIPGFLVFQKPQQDKLIFLGYYEGLTGNFIPTEF